MRRTSNAEKNWLPEARQVYNAMIEKLLIMSYLIIHFHHIMQLVFLLCSAKYSHFHLSFFLTSSQINKEQNLTSSFVDTTSMQRTSFTLNWSYKDEVSNILEKELKL